jgi:RNA recognition motif-containing protein
VQHERAGEADRSSLCGHQDGLNANGEEETKLYVAGLHWETSREKLQELFGQHGTVTDGARPLHQHVLQPLRQRSGCADNPYDVFLTVKLIVDHFSGRSRGFAFISFATSEDATAARDAMNSAVRSLIFLSPLPR